MGLSVAVQTQQQPPSRLGWRHQHQHLLSLVPTAHPRALAAAQAQVTQWYHHHQRRRRHHQKVGHLLPIDHLDHPQQQSGHYHYRRHHRPEQQLPVRRRPWLLLLLLLLLRGAAAPTSYMSCHCTPLPLPPPPRLFCHCAWQQMHCPTTGRGWIPSELHSGD